MSAERQPEPHSFCQRKQKILKALAERRWIPQSTGTDCWSEGANFDPRRRDCTYQPYGSGPPRDCKIATARGRQYQPPLRGIPCGNAGPRPTGLLCCACSGRSWHETSFRPVVQTSAVGPKSRHRISREPLAYQIEGR